ncbi:MAG: radical SAM protein [archaeon]|nr:radical SAM protein [archaeon]MCR4324027.1 radical SAM protein [Nanoarchaeota archaeon]
MWPKIVFIKITSQCNYNCKYCYDRKSSKESSTKDLIKAIKFLSSKDVEGIVITGGEPLLRKDFPKIIQSIKKQKMKVYLDTNGDLFPKYKEIISKDVSILGLPFDFANNQSYRGKNNKKNVLNILQYYKENNGPKIRVGTVVTKDNIDKLEKIGKILKRNKVDQWKIYQFFKISTTNSEKNKKGLAVTNKEFKEGSRDVVKKYSRDINILVSPKSSRNKAYFFIDSDLSVFIPSQESSTGRISLGSLLDKDILKKWLSKVNKEKNDRNLRRTFISP